MNILKKSILLLILIFCLCFLVSCGKTEEEVEVDTFNPFESLYENSDNREKIAEALEIERDDNRIGLILYSLYRVDAGRIESSIASDIDGGKILDVVSEDGVLFRILLSEDLSVETMQRIDPNSNLE